MTICVVVGCSMRTEFKQDCRISFHRFPKDPMVKEAWISAVSRENWLPSETSVLCSLHFEETCFKRFPKIVKLIDGAIPTLFPTYPSYCRNRKTLCNFMKMPMCVAYGCTNRASKEIPGVTFHRFPIDRTRREEWIKAVRRADWTPTFCSTLCSEHFKKSDFKMTPFRTFLKSNAVPSIFKGLPWWMQKKPSACCSPVSVSSSPPTKQGNPDRTLAAHILEAWRNDEVVVDQNKPEATSTFGNYDKNDCDKNTVVIVSDAANYKNVLNGHSDANRRIVISDQLKPKNRSFNAFTCIENVESTSNEVVVQNQSVATPTFSNYGKNDCDKNTLVIVCDTLEYKNVLNSHTDANRRIVISDQLTPENKFGSSLANTYQTSTVPETYEQSGVNMYEKDPLLLFDDEFHSRKIKELEEVAKALCEKRKNWIANIRSMKKKFKKLRKEYIRYNKKNHSLLHCNSQPVVHFLALDV